MSNLLKKAFTLALTINPKKMSLFLFVVAMCFAGNDEFPPLD